MTAPVQRPAIPPTPPSAGPAIGAAAGGAAIERAARDFAAILVGELLKVSLPSGSSGLFPSGVAGEIYRDTFVRSLAERIAAAPGFPLSARLAEAFGPRPKR